MFTNSKAEMGGCFKNNLFVKILGWISVFALIFLNMKGLPSQIEDFFSPNLARDQTI